MIGSLLLYSGAVLTLAGLLLVARPMPRLHVTTRPRALIVVASGVALAALGLFAPARESRVSRAQTRLDALMPAWQFRELHSIRVAAPPTVVFDAIRRLRADEILLFRTLTWIRRGGRPLPPGILNAVGDESLIDVALRTSFVELASDPPYELVVGTIVGAPPGASRDATPEMFRATLASGYALATMNFLVSDDGSGGSRVSTETRVFANSAPMRRRFAAYWRVIYPGSALIRRMWLRAILRRAAVESSRTASPRR